MPSAGASLRFLDEVLRENKDHVFIMQFDLTVQTRQALTGSRRDLSEALAYVDTPTRNQLRSQYGGGTLLFDAVVDASQEIMKKQKGRKALIVLSDGGDNGSDATLASAIEAAQQAETLIYSILFSDGGYGSSEGRNIMERLAKETGGGYFAVSKKLTDRSGLRVDPGRPAQPVQPGLCFGPARAGRGVPETPAYGETARVDRQRPRPVLGRSLLRGLRPMAPPSTSFSAFSLPGRGDCSAGSQQRRLCSAQDPFHRALRLLCRRDGTHRRAWPKHRSRRHGRATSCP